MSSLLLSIICDAFSFTAVTVRFQKKKEDTNLTKMKWTECTALKCPGDGVNYPGTTGVSVELSPGYLHPLLY